MFGPIDDAFVYFEFFEDPEIEEEKQRKREERREERRMERELERELADDEEEDDDLNRTTIWTTMTCSRWAEREQRLARRREGAKVERKKLGILRIDVILSSISDVLWSLCSCFFYFRVFVPSCEPPSRPPREAQPDMLPSSISI